MLKTFNNEYYVALECKDLQANAMAVDNTGTYVLLAGRRNIAIKTLTAEKDTIHKFPRQSKYDVNCAEWNPTEQRQELCAISSNQRLEILTWHPAGDLIQTNSLRAHTRVITDINWHQFDSNLVTSCSVDTFIHIWDLRDARRPSLSLSAIAEAAQVRWNRHSSHILATAHDGDVKIWDQRKGTSPVQYISAHLTKIHGLDWSHNSEHQLATSSQDHTVKFFDTTNPRRPESVLTTNAPVWRARYTPFGRGLITVVVPQLRRGENSLLLWNTTNRTTPLHTFIGHRDVVLEFQWRNQHPSAERDFQLITWSKDQTLLVWKIEPFLQKLCGYEPEEVRDLDDDSLPDTSITVDSPVELNKIPRKSSPRIQPLQQEFSLMNVQISNLDVKKMDISSRTCNVHVNINSFSIHLEVSFPNTYPFGVSPIFHIAPNSNVSDSIGMQLLQTLNQLAQQRVAKNRTCLEPCLRQMVATLEQLSANLKTDNFESTYNLEPSNPSGYNDAYIPFPRTSGAKFCSVGTLVCFGRPLMARRISTTKSEPQTMGTPRALSALAKRTSDHMTVSAYYFQRQRTRVKNHAKLATTIVHIYDALGLFYISKQLGADYILDGDVVAVCKHNANVAKCATGRLDLVQAWQLAELVADSLLHDDEEYWANHPFGYQLLQSLISHYAVQSDIQMAAMLSCVFSKIRDSFSMRKSSLKTLFSIGSGGSPYHTIPPADVIADGWVLPSIKSARSSSLDNLRLDSVQLAEPEPNPTSHLYEYYKLAYAETLYRWNLLYKRAEIVKHMCLPAEQHKGVEFQVECRDCFKSSKHCCCNSCKKFSLNCVVCRVSVRGSANCCVLCGHGGHTQHLHDWFECRSVCATGCGCKCLFDSKGIFEP